MIIRTKVAIALTPAAAIVADAVTSGGTPDIVQIITGLGFPTAFAIMWLTGMIVSKRELDRVIADRDAERAERQRLQNATAERAVPGLSRQALVFEQALPLVQEGTRLREALPLLEEIARLYRESQRSPGTARPQIDEA